jgi:very-short-patch-repair endonuclease
VAGGCDGLWARGRFVASGCGTAMGASSEQLGSHRRDRSVKGRPHQARGPSGPPQWPARGGGGHSAPWDPGDYGRAHAAGSRGRSRHPSVTTSGDGGGVPTPPGPALHQCCSSNNPGRRGARLRKAIEAKRHRTRSPLEDRFLAFVERWGIEEPESNVWLEGYEVDFLWRRVGLVVEMDGAAEHGTRAAVRRDRKKDRVLWRAGFRTMRLTDDALDAGEEVLSDLAQAGVSVDSWPRASSYSPPRRPRTSSASAT